MPQLWEGSEPVYVKQHKLIIRLQTELYFQLKESSFCKWRSFSNEKQQENQISRSIQQN